MLGVCVSPYATVPSPSTSPTLGKEMF